MQSEIRAPVHPNLLRVADALSGLDSRLKGSPAGLLVPSGMTDVLRQWSYGQPTSVSQKAMAALDAPGLPEGLSSIFVAALRKFPKEQVEKALGRLDAGESAADVWQQTGIAREPRTGNPVAEVDDSRMVIKNAPMSRADQTLETVMDHPELFAAAPELKGVRVRGEASDGGSWDPNKNRMVLPTGGGNPTKRTAVHEGEHAVASLDRRPGGQNPDNFGYAEKEKRIEANNAKMAQILRDFQKKGGDVRDSTNLPPAFIKLNKDTALLERQKEEALQRYRDELGESMARLSEGRMDLTARERLEDYPFDPSYFRRMTGTDVRNTKISPAHGGKDL